ncbi:MAG TPA: NAD-dependent epimerase/dehydratase family protein [Acidimicrobiia bacterium]|nr:NAD-dependent epimerase/dehydratase family protein [Acidimicrobiia bacterium]
MKTLVTGSAGFIGTHVSRAMSGEGFEVTGYDQVESSEPGINTIIGDLLDAEAVTAAVQGHEVVIHIGAIGDVYLAATNPELAAAVNVTGSTNIALAAEAAGARVVYASTWEVYGDPVYEPVDEKHPCEPDHPYNITKLAGERMLLACDRLRDVPVVALRMGTAYGLGMRPNSVFEIFIDRARRGEPITIQGDGSQGRQFTHVADIARAFVAAAKSDVRGMSLNVVSPEMISIKQLADVVSERFPTEVTYGQPRPGDVAPSYVSADQIAKTLGWKAEVSFEEGMAELLSANRD